MIHVSSGAVVEFTDVKDFPGYRVKFAEPIRQQLGLPTVAVGSLDSPLHAEEVLLNKRADLIALGRELLRSPYWPMETARQLNAAVDWPQQYLRALNR